MHLEHPTTIQLRSSSLELSYAILCAEEEEEEEDIERTREEETHNSDWSNMFNNSDKR